LFKTFPMPGTLSKRLPLAGEGRWGRLTRLFAVGERHLLSGFRRIEGLEKFEFIFAKPKPLSCAAEERVTSAAMSGESLPTLKANVFALP
jgi:hypothetical protein